MPARAADAEIEHQNSSQSISQSISQSSKQVSKQAITMFSHMARMPSRGLQHGNHNTTQCLYHQRPNPPNHITMSLPSKSRPPRNVSTITVQTRLTTCQVQQPAKEGRKVHTALGKTDLHMVWRQLTLIQLQLHLVVERVTVLCRNGRLCDKAVTGCPVHLERTADLSVV